MWKSILLEKVFACTITSMSRTSEIFSSVIKGPGGARLDATPGIKFFQGEQVFRGKPKKVSYQVGDEEILVEPFMSGGLAAPRVYDLRLRHYSGRVILNPDPQNPGGSVIAEVFTYVRPTFRFEQPGEGASGKDAADRTELHKLAGISKRTKIPIVYDLPDDIQRLFGIAVMKYEQEHITLAEMSIESGEGSAILKFPGTSEQADGGEVNPIHRRRSA